MTDTSTNTEPMIEAIGLSKFYGDFTAVHDVTYYEDSLREFEDFQQKVKQCQTRVRELTDRFAAWYYVIPGDSFEKLRFSRGDLVKVKEQEQDGDEESNAE